MYASKENAAKAKQIVDGLTSVEIPGDWSEQLEFLGDFLDKAAAKLPREASFKADTDRRERSNVPVKKMPRRKVGQSLRS